MKFVSFLLSLLLIVAPVQADDICSRTATINYQEILVDTSASKLGEGLRFYLEKDPEALKLLDKYQESNKIRWVNAAMSTTGSGLIIFGLFRPGKNEEKSSFMSREALILSGASLILVSYLISRTIQYNNEKYLLRSIDEYNKRNTPRIYFSPISDTSWPKTSIGLTAGLTQGF